MIYSLGILAKEIGPAIEKINEWLGKPVVITCDEVTPVQLPHAIKQACCTTGVDSVVFNTGIDEMQSVSNPRVHSGYHSYAGGSVVPGVPGTTFLNEIPGTPQFSGMEKEKDTVRFEQWFHSISDARKNFQ